MLTSYITLPLRHFFLFLVAFLCLLSLTSHVQPVVGFRSLVDPVYDRYPIHVWYPSSGVSRQGRLGPFDVDYAFDGDVMQGVFRVVVMSHGLEGWARNHHLTASRLVQAGFVVVGVNHDRNIEQLIGGVKTLHALKRRALELDRAVQVVRKDTIFAPHLAQNHLDGLGYSLGGATVLIGAGAAFDGKKVDDHCRRERDNNFCAYVEAKLSARSAAEVPRPFINGRIVAIASVGQGITPARAIDRDILTVGFGRDQQVKPLYHARYLKEIFPQARYFEIPQAHHYAFIAPFARRVTEREVIDVAIDPPGFDRSAFQEQINECIAAFFVFKDDQEACSPSS